MCGGGGGLTPAPPPLLPHDFSEGPRFPAITPISAKKSSEVLKKNSIFNRQSFWGMNRRLWVLGGPWPEIMGGGTGRAGGVGTGPPQTFQRLTLYLWALHEEN